MDMSFRLESSIELLDVSANRAIAHAKLFAKTIGRNIGIALDIVKYFLNLRI